MQPQGNDAEDPALHKHCAPCNPEVDAPDLEVDIIKSITPLINYMGWARNGVAGHIMHSAARYSVGCTHMFT